MPPPRWASARGDGSDAQDRVIRWLFLIVVVSFFGSATLVWHKLSAPRGVSRRVMRRLVSPVFRPKAVTFVLKREVSFPGDADARRHPRVGGPETAHETRDPSARTPEVTYEKMEVTPDAKSDAFWVRLFGGRYVTVALAEALAPVNRQALVRLTPEGFVVDKVDGLLMPLQVEPAGSFGLKTRLRNAVRRPEVESELDTTADLPGGAVVGSPLIGYVDRDLEATGVTEFRYGATEPVEAAGRTIDCVRLDYLFRGKRVRPGRSTEVWHGRSAEDYSRILFKQTFIELKGSLWLSHEFGPVPIRNEHRSTKEVDWQFTTGGRGADVPAEMLRRDSVEGAVEKTSLVKITELDRG